MMSLAPSYVFSFFDVCRLFVYRSSGRDVLDCLKFRINTILRVCQTENEVSFRCDVTALKSRKDKKKWIQISSAAQIKSKTRSSKKL